MAYTPINWQNGDTITAEKMNKMDNGWSVESAFSQFFSETVTTAEMQGLYAATLAYATQITADTLTVIVNGTEYTCSKFRDEDNFGPCNYYGGFGSNGPDFTTYPFFIRTGDDGTNMFVTTAEGTYTVVAGAVSETIEVSDNFAEVVSTVSVFSITDTSGTLNKTFAEIRDAFLAGKNCIINKGTEYRLVYAVDVNSLYVYIQGNYYAASSADAYPVYH